MKTLIAGKDCSLEETIGAMTTQLKTLGIRIEIVSWLNPVAYVWSVHIRDIDDSICFSNGKGSSKNAALASALGEYFERLSCNYFYADWYLGKEIAESAFVHYPNEKWFKIKENGLTEGLMDDYLWEQYNPERELSGHHLIDTNSGNTDRGICALPFERQSDKNNIFIPVNIIGNLFMSNGMSAGNSPFEARVQALSEILERYIKNKIITEQISLPTVPHSILKKYPKILEGIDQLEALGFPVVVKDASLGGLFPVISLVLMDPKSGGVFSSFGSHPNFMVALERTLTELLQGRSLENLELVQSPTFNEQAVVSRNNIEGHFIDSTGLLSWKFFSAKNDYEFTECDFCGSTEEEFNYLMSIFNKLERDVYIADYNHLGVYSCRILVPGVSEVYSTDDLSWDNNNRALVFRERVLLIHRLDKLELEALVNDLVESQLDDQMPFFEVVGVAFDPLTAWGQLRIGELKAMIYLALKNYEEALELIGQYIQFGDKNSIHMKLYRCLEGCLELKLDENLSFSDYAYEMQRLYGEEVYQNTLNIIEGETRFFGLFETDLSLKEIVPHTKLLASYEKLQIAKRKFWTQAEL